MSQTENDINILLSCRGDQDVRSVQRDRRWDTEKHNSLLRSWNIPATRGLSDPAREMSLCSCDQDIHRFQNLSYKNQPVVSQSSVIAVMTRRMWRLSCCRLTTVSQVSDVRAFYEHLNTPVWLSGALQHVNNRTLTKKRVTFSYCTDMN